MCFFFLQNCVVPENIHTYPHGKDIFLRCTYPFENSNLASKISTNCLIFENPHPLEFQSLLWGVGEGKGADICWYQVLLIFLKTEITCSETDLRGLISVVCKQHRNQFRHVSKILKKSRFTVPGKNGKILFVGSFTPLSSGNSSKSLVCF